MSLIFATQLTAVATAALAVFTIVTAFYARQAFRKQSQEVSAIERQVKDQQELTRQQAELLKVQSGQLELQRDQLDDQRKANALQAEELRESLAERARQRRVAERDQADAVNFAWWPASHVLIMGQDRPLPRTPRKVGTTAIVPVGGLEQMTVIVVGNASRRRILNAACRIEPSEGSGLTLATERTGQLTETSTSAHRAILNNPAEGSMVPLIRTGSQYGFLLNFDLEAHPGARLAARFTDDAGLHWQIDQDLHPQPLARRDW